MRLVAISSLILVACGPSNQDDSSTHSSSQAIQGDQVLTTSFKLPAGVPPESVAASSIGLLKMGDRTQVTGAAFSSTGRIEVRNDARVASVTAKQNVQLLDRARVTGNATSGGVVQIGNAAVVTGTVTNGATIATKEFSWTAKAPQASLGPVTLQPNAATSLAPNTYGALTVNARAKLTLETGVYVFDRIQVESQGELHIDSTDGPVQIHVKSGFTFRGVIKPATVGVPSVLFVYRGTQTAFIETSFTGAFVAPSAEVRMQAALPQGHNAFVHAQTLYLEPDTKLKPLIFDWVSILGPDAYQPSSEAPVSHPMPQSPSQTWVSYEGTGDNILSSTVTPGGPVTFQLPQKHPVQGGVIANGEVELAFQTSSGSVTCSYVGGSSTSTPTTPEELTKGQELLFQSCTDGLPAATNRTATSFTLTVHGVPGYPVTVTPPITKDGACSEEIEILSAAETRQMVSSFNWNAATKVAELDAQGRPTLYYSWIYIRDKEDMRALRQLYIHVLNQPLFKAEFDALAGRCGALANHGDGVGSFVSALIPGKTYNKLIDALTAQDIEGDRVIFDAVILRTVPEEVRTPQGSIKLEPLADSGFRYLHYEKDPFRDASEFELDSGIAAALAGVVEWVSQAVRDVGQWFDLALADIAKELGGRVRVSLDVRVLSQDPAFGPDHLALRAWGTFFNLPLTVSGVEARIIQSSPNMFVSAVSQGITDRQGRAVMDILAAPDLDVGFCLELSNSAAVVTDFILPTTICDLRGVGTAVETLPLSSIETHERLQVRMDVPRVMGLAQADDTHWYAREVLDAPPLRRAKILSGWHADTFSASMPSGLKRMFTPCLGWPNSLSDEGFVLATLAGGFAGSVATVFAGGIGTPLASLVAAVYSSSILTTDIVMPLNSILPRSREVMTHEYGHFVYCAMMQAANSSAVDNLIYSIIKNADADVAFPVRYINEAFAEFITGQVAGGADYPWLRRADQFNDYCIPPKGTCTGGATPGAECRVPEECVSGSCGVAPIPAPAFGYVCVGGLNDGGTCTIANGAAVCAGGSCQPPPPLDPGGYCFDHNFRTVSSVPSENHNIARLATLFHDVFDGQGQERQAKVPQDADQWQTSPGGLAPLRYSYLKYANTDSQIDRVALPGPALFEIILHLPWESLPGSVDPTLTDRGLQSAVNTVMENHGVNWCDRCQVLALHSPLTLHESARHLHDVCVTDPALIDLVPPPVPLDRMNHATCEECPPGLAADDTGACLDICPADIVLDGQTMSLSPATYSTTQSNLSGDTCPNVFVIRIENFGALEARGVTYVDTRLTLSPDNHATCERPFGLREKVWLGDALITRERAGYGTVPDCDGSFCTEDCVGLPFSQVGTSDANVVEFGTIVDGPTQIRIFPVVGTTK